MALSKQEWLELRRRYGAILDGTERHGEGDAQAQARRYWLEALAEPIIERAREKLGELGEVPRVDLLVSVAGFSPETTIVTAGAFQPREVLVISSGQPYDNIDVIADFLTQRGLRHSQFRHERCTAADLSVFEIVCRRVKEHRRLRAEMGGSDQDGETLIDITGGKKVMSAGAAMAAWELDLRISYVNNTYDSQRRTAVPGTEEIVLLDSPYSLYGGAELQRADHDFDLGAFEVARARYEKLAERLNEPARARFLRDLSCFYEAWRNLDIEGLQKIMPKVRERLAPPLLGRAHQAQLEAQLRFVERLVAEERPARVMTLFLLGEANSLAGRYDFSALLFYRTIEASIASRIEQRYPGFLCEKPDYTKIDADIGALQQRFQAAAKEVIPNEENFDLPRKIGCFDGALLLRAERDDLLEQAHFAQPKALAHLRNLTTTRNRSILAHGYKSVTDKDCKELRAPAERLLAAYWTLNSEAIPFKKAIEDLRFLRIEPR